MFGFYSDTGINWVIKKQMIQSLTGLRFYAALLVFVSHLYFVGYIVGIYDGPVYAFLEQLGWLGVSLFFVLSGFVLYINYNPETGKRTGARDFYIARIARVYPVFLLTTLLAIPIELFSSARQFNWQALGLSIGMVHCLEPSACLSFNAVGWSISNEFVFYLLFPALLLLFTARAGRNVMLALTVFLLYLAWMLWIASGSFYAQPTFPFNRVGEFLLGMYSGYLYLRYQNHGLWRHLASLRYTKPTMTAILVLLLGVMAIQPWVSEALPLVQPVYYLYYALPAAAIILLIALAEKQHIHLSVLSAPLVILGGEISYSFYLIHHLILRYTKHFFSLVLHLDLFHLPPVVAAIVTVMTLALSLAAAYVLYNTVEKPFRRSIIAFFKPKAMPAPVKTVTN